jgi:hypothetical protein
VAEIVTVFLPPWSQNLRKHGDSQMVMQWCTLSLSILFHLVATLQNGQVMPAEVYGYWITHYPAEWWARAIMAASTLYIVGILINGNWRWSPALRVIGAAGHVIIMSAFVIGAWGATFGDFFVLICLVMGVAHAVFLCWNLGDLTRAFGRRDA